MKKPFRIVLLALALLLAAPAGAWAAWRASLLTCGPGEEIYELYGHTALRLYNTETGDDRVYNYGMFNFDKPHFVWRFVMGQTDYELGVQNFDSFVYAYYYQGRSVVEQQLNLTPEEAGKLYTLLEENYRPENRVYRYNFLYDNCTTRAVAMLERAIDGHLVLPAGEEEKTFRDIIHEFSAGSPWDKAGQDLLIGAEVDRPVDLRRQFFAPMYAKRYLSYAVIEEPDGESRQLVWHTNKLVDGPAVAGGERVLTPGLVMALLFLAAAAACVRQWRRRRVSLVPDAAQMVLRGLVGCLIALLFFFSEHPAVDSNWLLLLLNPLPLLVLPVYIWRRRRGLRDLYHPVLLVLVLVFGAVWAAGVQSFQPEMIGLALILLMQCVTAIAVERNVRKQQSAAAAPARAAHIRDKQ